MNSKQKTELTIRNDYLAFGKPSFTAAEINAVSGALQSGWVGMGPETLSFEKELAEYVGANHLVAVNSCTSALFLSLLVSGIGEGDEVICPSLTWCSTANAAMYLGAVPVFCDVNRDTLCATPADIKARLSPRTKAVIVVHFGGLAADIDAIRRILPPGVALIEDAAHAIGARYADGSRVGSNGNLVCFSFYANKNLSTGEGGAIAVGSDEAIDRLRSLCHLGLSSDAWTRFRKPSANVRVGPAELGYKMNFTDLQAVIGRAQLARQEEMGKVRSDVAARYADMLAKLIPDIQVQQGIGLSHHARHLFPILLPLERLDVSRDEVLGLLRARNIGAAIHYPPLHEMSLYDQQATTLPNTDYIAERNITLPISANMTVTDAEYVMEHLAEILS